MKIGGLLRDLNRLLSNPSILLKVLAVWATVVLVVVGVFGIIPQIRLLLSNIQTYPKMIKINGALTEKINVIDEEYKKIEQNKNGVELLDTLLPDGYGIQNYIVDLSFATAKSGFQLSDLLVQGNVGFTSGVITTAAFEGDGSLGDLVATVESLKRVSQVSKLRFTSSSGEQKASLEINIYSLGENE